MMHSGFGGETPELQTQPVEATRAAAAAPMWMNVNQSHILHQIHSFSTPAQSHHHHFLPPPPHHGAGPSTGGEDYFPAVNFKLGLNEFCPRNEEYDVPETRHSLGFLHCWHQNQQHSSIKQQNQQPFWEPLEVSNENSEIVDRQEHMELTQKESQSQSQSQSQSLTPHCLNHNKDRVHFGELEAIYQTLPPHPNPTKTQDEEASLQKEKARKKNKRRRKGSSKYSEMIPPMAEFFCKLVKQMMSHQETLNNKLTEMIERLDEERRAREEKWRVEETARFEKEAQARAMEKTVADTREAMIVSYLEKLTGQKLSFSFRKQG